MVKKEKELPQRMGIQRIFNQEFLLNKDICVSTRDRVNNWQTDQENNENES